MSMRNYNLYNLIDVKANEVTSSRRKPLQQPNHVESLGQEASDVKTRWIWSIFAGIFHHASASAQFGR